MAGKESEPVSIVKDFLEQDLPLNAFVDGYIGAEAGQDIFYVDDIAKEEAEIQNNYPPKK